MNPAHHSSFRFRAWGASPGRIGRAAVAGVALFAASAPADLMPLAGGAAVVEQGPAPMKAYVKELRTPSGIQVLDDAPADHIHHHGWMLAVNVNGVEFWGEKPEAKVGRQIPVSTERIADGTLVQALRWTLPDGVTAMDESRRIDAAAGDGGRPTRLTWVSELRAPAGGPAAELGGRHYFGLGMRFVADFSGAAEFVFEDGATNRVVRRDERLTPGRWCAARGAVGGKPVTIAVFDDPGNPRHPCEWFTMVKPFAYITATLGVQNHPITIEPGTVLRLRWGVAAWDGHIAPEAVAAAWAEWAGRAAPSGSVGSD